ncbi:MAG: hypothetical protein JWM15_247 [Cryptosporangiaceae bacterium]|nr:hypothetical protein [Cryptosporangiaceae bacterium]
MRWRDQEVYLRALHAVGAVDHVEFGTHVVRVVHAPWAVKGPKGKPVLATADRPVRVQDRDGEPVSGARVMVSVAVGGQGLGRQLSSPTCPASPVPGQFCPGSVDLRHRRREL